MTSKSKVRCIQEAASTTVDVSEVVQSHYYQSIVQESTMRQLFMDDADARVNEANCYAGRK